LRLRLGAERGALNVRRGERVDLSVYVKAVAVFARNPTVIVVPLLVAFIAIFLGQVGGFTRTDAVTGGLVSFIVQLLQLFALGVSIIIADAGWRRGMASFDEAWQDARRKAGDLLFAALGVTFVVQVAQLAGSFLGTAGVLVLSALAVYGMVFAMPAAAIGGLPGVAAINASVERVRANPLAAAALAIVTVVVMFAFRAFVGAWIQDAVFNAIGPSMLGPVLSAVATSIAYGYVATVSAAVYSQLAFTRY
jgi:hypothetical protein